MRFINVRELKLKTNKVLGLSKRNGHVMLHKILQSYADKDTSSCYQTLVPEMGKSFGTPKPVLVIIANELGKYGQKSPKPIFSLLKTLWKNGSYEERDIVGKAIEKLGKKYPDECLSLIPYFLPDINNWSVCDVLAGMGMRPIVISRTKEVLLLCEKCVKDRNKWIRRFGIVTLWTFKKITAPPEIFEIFNQVMTDEDKDVKKGVAWILRQITIKNSTQVSTFLTKWAKANPNKNTRWIIKNGMKKLSSNEQKEILKLIG
ncbi:MAG: DNA alkylation repair protein [Candidatus Firestonebacteria bacterium]